MTKDEDTALHIAARHGYIHAVKFLLQMGAGVNYANVHRRTPLHEAVYSGSLDVVRCIVEAGVWSSRDHKNETPLMIAERLRHKDIVKYFEELERRRQPDDGNDEGFEEEEATEGERENASQKEPGRIRYRESRLNAAGIRKETDSKVKTAQEGPKPRSTSHAITILRVYDDAGKYKSSEIKIEDEGLRTLLLDAFAHLPRYRHRGNVELNSPFEEVIHNWEKLQDLSTLDDSKIAVFELRRILEIFGDPPEDVYSDEINNLRILRDDTALKAAANDLKLLLEEIKLAPELQYCFAAGKTPGEMGDTISYNNLWTIFAPGDLVYSSSVFFKQPQLYIVQCSDSKMKETHIRSGNKVEVWRLYCWTYDWDGTAFNRVLVHFDFESFQEDKRITSLPCYPWGYNKFEWTYSDSLMKELIERGKKFCYLCVKPEIVEYDGMVISHGAGSRKTNGNPSEMRHDRSSYGSPVDLLSASSCQQQTVSQILSV